MSLLLARPDTGSRVRFARRREAFAALLVTPALLACTSLAAAPRSGDSEVEQPAERPFALSHPDTGQGPKGLREQVRITVETNAPAPPEGAKAVAPGKRAFLWDASLGGWDGLHVAVSRKTRLADPLADARSWIDGAHAGRVLHLEELQMRGKIGAKFAVDAATFATDGLDDFDFDSGVELRRARLYAKGDCLLVLPVSYQIELGYIPNEFYIEESYLSFKDLPGIGELKAGQYQAPMGLDVITGSRDITFMEPAASLQALAPGVNAGIQMGRPVLRQRATWRFGLFTDGVGQDFGEATQSYGRAIVRFTGLPWYRTEPTAGDDTRLLHLGASANILYSASSAIRYRARPESHLAPHVLDTGDIEADESMVVGTEMAWVSGPFSLQGEYLHSWVRERGGQTIGFDGMYFSASWFLTGEARPYDPVEGMFGRLVPKRAFDFGGHWGAWEIAARYSYTDLDGGDIRGGRLSMGMAGINWYPHGHVRWRFNYGLGRVNGGESEGDLQVFETRVEVDF